MPRAMLYSERNRKRMIVREPLAVPFAHDRLPPRHEHEPAIDFSQCGLADPELMKIMHARVGEKLRARYARKVVK